MLTHDLLKWEGRRETLTKGYLRSDKIFLLRSASDDDVENVVRTHSPRIKFPVTAKCVPNTRLFYLQLNSVKNPHIPFMTDVIHRF